jgi:hypothetical protein
MDARSAIEDMRRRAAAGETLETLSHAVLALLSRPAAAVGGVAFDEEARQMALRLTGRTMIHGGRVAGEERLRGARFLAGSLHVLADGGGPAMCSAACRPAVSSAYRSTLYSSGGGAPAWPGSVAATSRSPARPGCAITST